MLEKTISQKLGYDMEALVKSDVDSGEFHDLVEQYATHLVNGFIDAQDCYETFRDVMQSMLLSMILEGKVDKNLIAESMKEYFDFVDTINDDILILDLCDESDYLMKESISRICVAFTIIAYMMRVANISK